MAAQTITRLNECVSPRWAQFDTIKGGGRSVLDSAAHTEAIVVAVVSQSIGAECQYLTISRWRIFIVVVAWRNLQGSKSDDTSDEWEVN